MINRKAKGKRNEVKSEEWLKKLGYIVESVKATKSYGKQDFFGLFDHIAVSTTNVGFKTDKIDKDGKEEVVLQKEGDILFVQTKTNRKPSRKDMEGQIAFKVKGKKILLIWEDRESLPRVISLES